MSFMQERAKQLAAETHTIILVVNRNFNKTGMDRFQDCCKEKATNALLQS